MPAVVPMLQGRKAHQMLTAAQCNGFTHAVSLKTPFLTGNTNCSLMLMHATL